MERSDRSYSRRTVLKTSGGALAVGVLAGCSAEEDSGNGNGNGGNGNGGNGNGDTTTTDSGPSQTTVAARNFEFAPEEVTVSVGDTVVWEFESAGHNVVGWPDAHEQVAVPEGEGFGSVEQGGEYFSNLADEGETYEHTFDAAGEYTYVCMPHVSQGMVGTVVVES
jgi:plastocyanin